MIQRLLPRNYVAHKPYNLVETKDVTSVVDLSTTSRCKELTNVSTGRNLQVPYDTLCVLKSGDTIF